MAVVRRASVGSSLSGPSGAGWRGGQVVAGSPCWFLSTHSRALGSGSVEALGALERTGQVAELTQVSRIRGGLTGEEVKAGDPAHLRGPLLTSEWSEKGSCPVGTGLLVSPRQAQS